MFHLLDLLLVIGERSSQGEQMGEIMEGLLGAGYDPQEIDMALSYFVNKMNREKKESLGLRVLSSEEKRCVTQESYGYLLRLMSMGILDDEDFEDIMTEVTLHRRPLNFKEVKEIVLGVVLDEVTSYGDE